MNTLNSEISFAQIKELIGFATDHDYFDWISLAIPLIAVVLGYKVINHAVQVINEKVIEKEVGILFEAVNCFFEYTDAVGLYFSMTEKKIDNIVNQKQPDSDFEKKEKDATDAVYNKHRDVRKTSFLLRALDQKTIADQIDTYREATINLRKELILLLKEYFENDDPKPLVDCLKNLKSKRMALIKMKDECLDALARCKYDLKAPDKQASNS